MKILVAMSGGIDSSVVAHMLKEQGHELIGVMMQLWTDPLAPPVERAIPTKCCSVEHIQRARSVCQTLDIPFYVVNLENEFKDNVVDPFLKDYEEGRTPNPCINCNRTIKFGTLIDKMQELGCERIATGHYARIEERDDYFQLLEAIDKRKDQSYYLYALPQETLSKVLFPLGDMQKSDVYALATHYSVPLYDSYRESQDLCFFPEKEPTDFLKRYIRTIKEGDIVTEDGVKVGEHKGLPFYTIGQRKGLGIGGLSIPLHVVSKDPESNTIVVAKDGDDMSSELTASQLRWIHEEPKHEKELHFDARINSLGTRYKGTLQIKDDKAHFQFDQKIRGIAPGQSLVLYKNDCVVGGGVID